MAPSFFLSPARCLAPACRKTGPGDAAGRGSHGGEKHTTVDSAVATTTARRKIRSWFHGSNSTRWKVRLADLHVPSAEDRVTRWLGDRNGWPTLAECPEPHQPRCATWEADRMPATSAIRGPQRVASADATHCTPEESYFFFGHSWAVSTPSLLRS